MFKIRIIQQHVNEKGNTSGRRFEYLDEGYEHRCQDDMDGIIRNLKVNEAYLIRQGIEELTDIVILFQEDEEGNTKNVTQKYLLAFIKALEYWTGDLHLPLKHRRNTPQRKKVIQHFKENGVELY